jgi:hypothetical protein
VIREFSAGGLVVRNFRGRPHLGEPVLKIVGFYLLRYLSGGVRNHD